MGYPLWGQVSPFGRLNESPSQKEGKFEFAAPRPVRRFASMKAPPKRKGNFVVIGLSHLMHSASMKALPRRKGNLS